MRFRQPIFCVLLIGNLAVSLAKGVETVSVRGTLESVTVYRGQALVTRQIAVPGPAGLREVTVTDLPEQVQANSIFAEGGSGIEVRSVRYRQRPMPQDVREEVRKLDDARRSIDNKLAANKRFAETLVEQKAYLAKLEAFVAPTAMAELTKGVLNAETLKVLTEFLASQRREVAEQELKLATELRQLNNEIQLVERERAVLSTDSARTLREVVVLVNLTGTGGKLRLNYLVNQASWSPSYTARATADLKRVTLDYSAQIQQMSGEDWTDVVMILSTATPSLVARAPELLPMKVSLTRAAPPEANAPQLADEAVSLGVLKSQLSERRRQIESSRLNSAGRAVEMPRGSSANAPAQTTVALDKMLNEVAAEDQVFDLLNRRSDTRSAVAATADDVSVTYRLEQRSSLPSRADQQMVQIASLAMNAKFYKLALPVLTMHVYNEAVATNAGTTVLLAGPVSSYLGEQFVGLGQIPTVAVGENVTLGFGIDSSLRARRELVHEHENVQGGNRVVDFTYRVAIENFGPEAVAVRLMDRMPTAKDSEAKLTLVSTGVELSNDPRYRQSQAGKGLLRWDTSVPAKASGPQAMTVEYQLRLEYDRQMSIVGVPLATAP